MEGGAYSGNFSIYLMLVICVVLVSIDTIEMVNIVHTWKKVDRIPTEIFNSCVKSDLLVKTAFSFFSLLAAVSASLFTISLAISVEYFVNKLMPSFLYGAFFIFGPCMLGFSIFGLTQWNEVVFFCDARNYKIKDFSVGNMLALLGCFLFSLTMTVGCSVYHTTIIYIDSLLRRENGSKLLRSIFWWTVLRTGDNNFLRRNEEEGEGENNNGANNGENNNEEHNIDNEHENDFMLYNNNNVDNQGENVEHV